MAFIKQQKNKNMLLKIKNRVLFFVQNFKILIKDRDNKVTEIPLKNITKREKSFNK